VEKKYKSSISISVNAVCTLQIMENGGMLKSLRNNFSNTFTFPIRKETEWLHQGHNFIKAFKGEVLPDTPAALAQTLPERY
jgi:hypothetical protein